jgi:crotonobetainyl-CoA:carnitine CoA-transferase CaiB-like acyl-CoA transferase
MSLAATIGAILAAVGALLAALWGARRKGRSEGVQAAHKAAREAAATKQKDMTNAGDAVDRSRDGTVERLRKHDAF